MLLYQQLTKLSRKLRQLDQSYSSLDIDSERHLSPARLTVLNMIKQHTPVTLKELALLQSVSLPTLSKIIDELQKRSLVIRAQSKDDARQRWIVPTQKGIQTLKSSESQSNEFWQKKLKQLSPAQLEQLELSLELLMEAL